ncbi:MAG: hypothetical protein KC486_32695 [Myxococcales bacterium]|nr:hypothetical protein [Myxococcales bacterium]
MAILACNASGPQPQPVASAEPPTRAPAPSPSPEATKIAEPTAATEPVPAPTPLTPEPPQPDLPADAVAVQLAAELVALDREELPSPAKLKAKLHLPPGTPWPLLSPDAGSKTVTVPIAGERGPLELRLIMEDGTWEPPRGESWRTGEAKLRGVELRGAVGLPSPSPAGASRIDVIAVDSDGAEDSREAVTAWGDFTYFRPMPAGGRWYLGRYLDRAPFHYTDAERRALEDALLDITQAIADGSARPGDHIRERYAARRRGQSDLYDFGAGTIHVASDAAFAVALVGPMRLPRFFRGRGLTFLATSFAHDYGDQAEPMAGPGFTFDPGLYFFGTPYASSDADMGDPAAARFVTFSIRAEPPSAAR